MLMWQRREEEKRLLEEEEAKRELLRREKVRLAEERVVEERRARLLLEKAEHEVGHFQATPRCPVWYRRNFPRMFHASNRSSNPTP